MREFGFAENVRHLGSRMRRIGLGPAEKKVGSASSHRSRSHGSSTDLFWNRIVLHIFDFWTTFWEGQIGLLRWLRSGGEFILVHFLVPKHRSTRPDPSRIPAGSRLDPRGVPVGTPPPHILIDFNRFYQISTDFNRFY